VSATPRVTHGMCGVYLRALARDFARGSAQGTITYRCVLTTANQRSVFTRVYGVSVGTYGIVSCEVVAACETLAIVTGVSFAIVVRPANSTY
jgi:hypothetical protein